MTVGQSLATGIGYQPLPAEIRQELSQVAAARPGAALTAAEQRLADLIVGGTNNREAAEALFVSAGTVQTHLASIYRKLGVRTRTEPRSRPAKQSSIHSSSAVPGLIRATGAAPPNVHVCFGLRQAAASCRNRQRQVLARGGDPV